MENKGRVVFLSGLGADHRAFSLLDLDDFDTKFVDWIDPLDGESFQHYGLRLTEDLHLSPQDSLVGLSMGGIIAQEIAETIPVRKIVLISSLKHDQDEPWIFPFGRKIGFPSPLSPKAIKLAIKGLLNIYPPLRKDHLKIFKEMVESFSPEFYYWAIKGILTWDHPTVNVPIAQIHGTKDEVFPPANAKGAEMITGATHLMVATHAQQVSAFLKKELTNP
ncbi:MAG: alpha/beta hydrolase [Bacteroidota bacterium]|nr:alpha/beta hydrolase [Bacteroidota bacterium]